MDKRHRNIRLHAAAGSVCATGCDSAGGRRVGDRLARPHRGHDGQCAADPLHPRAGRLAQPARDCW